MNEKEITAKVLEALEEIRPFLASDGGDISLVSIEGNVVNVQLQSRTNLGLIARQGCARLL